MERSEKFLKFVSMEEKGNISLLELQESVCEAISENFSEELWVRAEISELKRNRHVYLTLVEKDSDSSDVVARAQAVIWASSARVIEPYFESSAGARLGVGMNILVKVQVRFSEIYGFSLIVTDIDPSYTLGGLEAQRQKTIQRLQQEGMFEMNSSLHTAALPRRFAVVSSETAAGWRDFLVHLHENSFGYEFETDLYPARMQGAECPASIISAMDAVVSSGKSYDALLILRGGGGALDLSCYDDYDLAVNVACFPLPVMTAIGHDHDFHVVDMVAHTSVKTPTALADFILDIFSEADATVEDLARRLQLAVGSRLGAMESKVDLIRMRISNALAGKASEALHRIEKLEMRIKAASPSGMLEKGFAIVLKDGRRTFLTSDLKKGDKVKIMLSDGTVDAVID